MIFSTQENQNIFSSSTHTVRVRCILVVIGQREMATGGKRGKLAVSAPVTYRPGARGGHFGLIV